MLQRKGVFLSHINVANDVGLCLVLMEECSTSVCQNAN